MDVTATITGNLAADPRLTHLPDGTPSPSCGSWSAGAG
jgi:hypothetical protein